MVNVKLVVFYFVSTWNPENLKHTKWAQGTIFFGLLFTGRDPGIISTIQPHPHHQRITHIPTKTQPQIGSKSRFDAVKETEVSYFGGLDIFWEHSFFLLQFPYSYYLENSIACSTRQSERPPKLTSMFFFSFLFTIPPLPFRFITISFPTYREKKKRNLLVDLRWILQRSRWQHGRNTNRITTELTGLND